MEINDPRIQLPAIIARNERTVRGRFWPKLRQSLGYVPFAPDLLAAFYCALDPQTPAKVKAVLLAALAYFIAPVDMVPDFIAALGFTDDVTVLLTAITMVRGHITSAHHEKADEIINQLKAGQG